ncbi:MAG: hypothetical protein ACOX6D_05800 [Thermoguttaceae bacterium]|jgi:hypothetical protein
MSGRHEIYGADPHDPVWDEIYLAVRERYPIERFIEYGSAQFYARLADWDDLIRRAAIVLIDREQEILFARYRPRRRSGKYPGRNRQMS